MGTTPMQHLADLLSDHDGDDRCGCLRRALLDSIDGEPIEATIRHIANCLARHPAGLTMRERFNRSVNRSLD